MTSPRQKKREDLITQLCDVTPPPKIVAGQPIRRVMMIAKQAESLYDLLRSRFGYTIESGTNFRAIGWDWRLAIDDYRVQDDIKRAIHDLFLATGEKVAIFLHSTGGLVFRKLIENDPSIKSEIATIISFGVPWAGTLKALLYLTDGEAMGFLTAKLSAAQTRRIIRSARPRTILFHRILTEPISKRQMVLLSNWCATAPAAPSPP
jgi:hypothetical protein